jgi:epoxyqueuosine reductase QueG
VSFARETTDAGFAPRADVAFPDIEAFTSMDEPEFTRRYGTTPFTRPGLSGMKRNAVID